MSHTSQTLDLAILPDGWLEAEEAALLYRLALNSERLLEVGSWVGRSTCSIAQGVRDADHPVRFDSIDFGICGVRDWMRRFDNMVPWAYDELPDQIKLTEAISKTGGITATLIQNLADRDLYQYVTTLAQTSIRDFESASSYDSVFIDITHGEEETRANIPLVKPFLADDYVLVCDDVQTEAHARIVADILGCEFWVSRPVRPYTKFGVFWSPQASQRAKAVIGE